MSHTETEAPVLLTVRQLARHPIHLLLRDRITFGRDCDGFLLADTRASRRHAELRLVGGRVVVSDLGSSNGTSCNGRSIEGETELSTGDVVGIGSSEIVVGTAVATALAASVDAGPVRELTTEMEAAERPRTSVIRLSESVQAYDYVEDLTASSTAEGTFTIVFSDIESSTTKATAMGDESWLRVLDVHNRIVRTQLDRHGGREIKSQGDGFMMSFGSARRAVAFAIDTQREMSRRRRLHPAWDILVRIGVHTGEAMQTPDGDLYGRHVIIASRIADQAAGGEILVSSLVRELTEGKIDLVYDRGRTVTLKGIGDQTVHHVRWSTGNDR
jgi:class 3 adenylate cyclase